MCLWFASEQEKQNEKKRTDLFRTTCLVHLLSNGGLPPVQYCSCCWVRLVCKETQTTNVRFLPSELSSHCKRKWKQFCPHPNECFGKNEPRKLSSTFLVSRGELLRHLPFRQTSFASPSAGWINNTDVGLTLGTTAHVRVKPTTGERFLVWANIWRLGGIFLPIWSEMWTGYWRIRE